MTAEIIPFPWLAPAPAERKATPAKVLILPVIRIERYTHVPVDEKLEGELARVLEAIREFPL